MEVMDGKVVVSVLMPAYNHEKYIGQAIESFLAQKGEVAEHSELLISDDASTDNTASVALHYSELYPNRVKLVANSTNLGLIKNYASLISRAEGEFIAILESDDYWIDEYKLQKQVSVLRENKRCGLVCTAGYFVDKDGTILGRKSEKSGERRDIYEAMLFSNPVLAVTACFRRELFLKVCNMEDFVERNFVTFDYPVWIALASASSFYLLDDCTSAYRVWGESISNNSRYEKREAFVKGIDEIIEYSIAKFGYCGNMAKLKNERIVKQMILALSFNRIDRYHYLCKEIDASVGIKWFVLRYIPLLFRFKKRKLIGTGAVSLMK